MASKGPTAGALALGRWLVIAAALPGCAEVVHRPLPPGDEAADRAATGIRYYESALYLLVHSDGRGGIATRIIELPDTTRPMVAEPRAFLSRVEGTMEFQGGMLVRAGEEPDTTAVPAAVLDAAARFAREAAAVRSDRPASGAERAEFPAPYLYRIEVRGGSVEFHGGQGNAPVRIPLPAPAGTEAPAP